MNCHSVNQMVLCTDVIFLKQNESFSVKLRLLSSLIIWIQSTGNVWCVKCLQLHCIHKKVYRKVYNNEFILGSTRFHSEMVSWIATNTIGSYCLLKSHTCHITSSLLQHVIKMSSSSMNAGGGRWRHSPTARSVTVWLRAAHSLLMRHFSLSTFNLKMNMK